jgi:hypothetical protein
MRSPAQAIKAAAPQKHHSAAYAVQNFSSLGLLLSLWAIDDAEFPRLGPVVRNLNAFRREAPLQELADRCGPARHAPDKTPIVERLQLLHEVAQEYERMAEKVCGRAQAS